jgi:crotonyl-CoA reductase
VRGVQPPDKVEICHRIGAELVIDRTARGTGSGATRRPRTRASGSGSGNRIRELTGGDDPDVVFEHPGRETFGASVYVTRAAARSSPARRRRATCTSTTTGTCG